MLYLLRSRTVWAGVAVTALLACAIATATAAVPPLNVAALSVPGCGTDCASMVAMHHQNLFDGILSYLVNGSQ